MSIHTTRRNLLLGAGTCVLAVGAGAVGALLQSTEAPVTAIPAEHPVNRIREAVVAGGKRERLAQLAADDVPAELRRRLLTLPNLETDDVDEFDSELAQLPDEIFVPPRRPEILQPEQPPKVARVETPESPPKKEGGKKAAQAPRTREEPEEKPEKKGLLSALFRPNKPEIKAPNIFRNGSYVIYNIHTRERVEVGYRGDFKSFRRVMADWRQHKSYNHPQALYELYTRVMRDMGVSYSELISGYRTPESNSTVEGASGSYHKSGRAFDLRTSMRSSDLKRLRDLGLKYGEGGVGYYPARDRMFVHLDVGPKGRYWTGKVT